MLHRQGCGLLCAIQGGRGLLRTALEATAALDSPEQPAPLPVQHRRDQNPVSFLAEA